MEIYLILLGVFIFSSFVSMAIRFSKKAKLYDELKPEFDKINEREKQLKIDRANWNEKVIEHKKALNQMAKEKSQGFPWLAEAYAEYFYLEDLKTADYLENKKRPAKKTAEHVRELASKRRLAEKLHRILKYQLKYYENLFPWFVDFKGEDLDDLIRQTVDKMTKGKEEEETSEDPVKHWVSQGEYKQLSTIERNQRALDRYLQKSKSKWEIGRDYERYVGYLYENEKWNVYYQGIVEGFADLGRDLIASKDNKIQIVQCKCWSQERTIHEKHIFQLYGTVLAFKIDNPNKSISAVFFTSTKLSDRAKKFADVLKIKYFENYPLRRYPCIKCNVARRDGTKIYHLQFDQQYDRTKIEEERSECYVETVKEADDLGFRRAFKWRGI